MATVVLTSVFPAGTSASAYARPAGMLPPGDIAPPGALGAAAASASVDTDSTLTFSGLEYSTDYFAHASVGGVHEYVQFRTADLVVTDGLTASAGELNILDGATLSTAELNILDGATLDVGELNRLDGLGGTPIATREATITESAGAGVYTGSVTVPAGATIIDVIVNGVALWNPATSATLKVGDVADDDGFFTGVDLKATDLLAGESLSLLAAGGKAGAYVANSQVSPRYSASSRVVSAIVTTVGGSGTTGRTRMTVVYSLPVSTDIVAATKV